ncbi:MAG TPA: DHA2 family efflux MFS transporter permease subunit [Bryobacteraceae bacterium]|jgi:DHA2 family multidrug resistance protein|nr:DHA2 family efflux MFS transporter permease subunit [Bryobacteraceae bacterium]
MATEVAPLPEIAPKPAAIITTQEWKPAVNPWIIAMSVMMATFMEVLDTSVANVALPHIAGNLSASNDEATWVLTSYLMANAVVLPATGWLGRRFGRQRFLLFCLVLFTASSFLCGFAVSLPMLIFARILQGAGGGALQPIAQAVLIESFPKEKQGQAIGVYGIGVVVAPIIGPVLGGWITDNYSWRWVFYINVPIGVLAFFMLRQFVHDPPWIKNARATIGSIDGLGFALMALWLGAQEVVLDKGQDDDWFSSNFIRGLAITAALAFAFFLIREFKTKGPIVDLRMLGDRNYGFGTLLIGVVGALLYGVTTLLPLFMQTLLGYSAYSSGLAIAPRGMGALIGMAVCGNLIGRIDSRFLALFGFAVCGLSVWQFSHLDLIMNPGTIFFSNVINGLSTAFMFVPLNTLSFGTLSREQVGNATGVYNLMRNVGGSVGISIVSTMLARRAQVHQAMMTAHLSPFNPIYQQTLRGYQATLSHQMSSSDASQKALGLLGGMVQQQATMGAVIDIFQGAVLTAGAAGLLVFVLKNVKTRGPTGAH